MSQINNQVLFRKKLITSTIFIVFLITLMGIASLFSIWSLEKEYKRNQIKLNTLRTEYEKLSEAQIYTKGIQLNLNTIFLKTEDRNLRIKYKTALEINLSKLGEILNELENNIFISHNEDIITFKKEFQILFGSYKDIASKAAPTSIIAGQKLLNMSIDQENKLIIMRHKISQEFIQTELNLSLEFDSHYRQLSLLLKITSIFALFLAFINLVKALKVSSE